MTLIESLIAAALLLTVVTAILGALSAGHQHALEAKRLVTASLAAEDLMARITTARYSELEQWNGWNETPGTISGADDAPLPSLFNLIGRRVAIEPSSHELDALKVLVRGSTVTIESYDQDGRTLTTLVRFIPEPQT